MLMLVASWAMAQDAAPNNWFHLNQDKDGYPGLSTEKVYQEILKGRQARKVIVAVIDSGVDAEHEDLAANMWVNEDEIPGNGIDDDQNGYIDDIHGWNFIGGKDGKNVQQENLEVVRLYNKLKGKYEGKSASDFSGKEKEEFEQFQEYKEEIDNKREDLGPKVMQFGAILGAFDKLIEQVGKEPADITIEDLQKFKTEDPVMTQVANMAQGFVEQGQSFGDVYKELKGYFDYLDGQFNYNYNPDFDARSIVGDDPSNVEDRNYGNNDVEGPDAQHGTHVAGIIGAVRGNDIGMDGVADNVLIMSVRAVPDGDERDKDVANAIRYAVDNGAEIINMSFGKGYSPYKKAVDDAVKYAKKNDVLLVHAAGNAAQQNQMDNNYPNDRYAKKGLFAPKEAKNWIEVGALNYGEGEDLVASFSNYSPEFVDVFAPGVEIYATVPNDKYEKLQGTSMASPTVAGVAAILRSYFPTLTANQVKDIIMDSAQPFKGKVIKPGTEELVPFSDLSVTGGMVNAYEAVKQAMMTKGKRKFEWKKVEKKDKKDVVVP
ncbi:S8 family peptidase [Flavilitoribacter nigricans]|nr:S8 family peptidase [Flavilitoribacter nigricans]